MSVVAALKKLSGLEQAARDLYLFYARIFSEDAQAAQLFSGMARQEGEHRDLVDFQLRLVVGNSSVFQEVKMDGRGIDAVRQAVEEHIGEGVFELADAVQFALWLEATMAETHYSQNLRQAGLAISRLLDSLRKGDEAHQRQLQGYADQLGIKALT